MFTLRPEPRPSVKTTAWSPCYACFDSSGILSYSTLVIIQLLMHEIWTWENEIADGNQAATESGAGLSQCDTPERIPHESELLPCHYFDFFYGAAHGGLIATLLGRLRMRVDDAIDHFQNITRATTSHRQLFTSGLSLSNRILDRPKFRYKDLVDAVHDTITKHSIKTSECGGTDKKFRNPFALLAHPCEDPRHAQTCILVMADTINPFTHKRTTFNSRMENKQLLRTFRFAAGGNNRPRDILDVRFADQLDLTICQVLWAAMATPGLLRPFRKSIGTIAVEFSDASIYETDITTSAFNDYDFLYQRPTSSEQTPWSLSNPWVDVPVPALFLRIGCSMAADEKEPLREEIVTVRMR
jgi:hypothetical protein